MTPLFVMVSLSNHGIPPNALGGEVVHSDLAGAEKQGGKLVRHDPVDLFGHAAVEAAQARLHVGDGDVEFGRGKRAGQRGVGVAVDQNPVGFFVDEDFLDSGEHLSCLRAVRPGTDGQVVFGLRNFEFPEKDSGHAVVVVLAGVDEKLVQGAMFNVQCSRFNGRRMFKVQRSKFYVRGTRV